MGCMHSSSARIHPESPIETFLHDDTYIQKTPSPVEEASLFYRQQSLTQRELNAYIERIYRATRTAHHL